MTIIRYDPNFYPQFKKHDVRVKHQFDDCLEIFEKNPMDAQLKNHPLHGKWVGYRGIHIGDPKNDYLAVYKETIVKKDYIAKFVALDTHEILFGI